MNSKRTVLMITILAALIGVGAMGTMSWADDVNPATERLIHLTSVGVAPGQAVSLNFTNLAKEPLTAQFFVFDDRGVNHLSADEALIEPGHTASMTLPYEAAPGPLGRRQIRGMIKVTSRTGAITDGTINASLEIFDSRTGRSEIALSLGQLGAHNYHNYEVSPQPKIEK